MYAEFSKQDPCYPVRISVSERFLEKKDGTASAHLSIAETNELIRELQEALIKAEAERRLRVWAAEQEAQS